MVPEQLVRLVSVTMCAVLAACATPLGSHRSDAQELFSSARYSMHFPPTVLPDADQRLAVPYGYTVAEPWIALKAVSGADLSYRVAMTNGEVELSPVPLAERPWWETDDALVAPACTKDDSKREPCILHVWAISGKQPLGIGVLRGSVDLWEQQESGEWRVVLSEGVPISITVWNDAVYCFLRQHGRRSNSRGLLVRLRYDADGWRAWYAIWPDWDVGPVGRLADGSLVMFTSSGFLRIHKDETLEPLVAMPWAESGGLPGLTSAADSLVVTPDNVVYVGLPGGVIRAYPHAGGWHSEYLMPTERYEECSCAPKSDGSTPESVNAVEMGGATGGEADGCRGCTQP